MNLPTDNAEHPVLLVIADISGYTRFMLANRESLVHAQVVVTRLTEAVVEQARIPLQVAKLEGDAVFLAAVKEEERGWEDDPAALAQQLLAFFDAFQTRLAQLAADNRCRCGGCVNLGKLTLKVVAHSGRAVFYEQHGFTELAGPDVILAHRLLKNSVEQNEYLLLTDQARADIRLSDSLLTKGQEVDADLGVIPTWLHLPGVEPGEAVSPTPWPARFFSESRKLTRTLGSMIGLRGALTFRNLPPGP